jgi:polyhydroxybutyrate depolymerase
MSRVVRGILTLAFVAVAFVPAARTAAAATCSTKGTGGLEMRRIGLDSYSIFVPDGIPAGKRVPLVVMLHGRGAAAGFPGRTGWVPFAANRRMIVAFPSAPLLTWLRTEGSPDVGVVRRVIAHIRSVNCVDARRVYAGGVSDGGYMAARLACDAADVFAAVAVVAGGDAAGLGSGCSPSEPVAVAHFHGSADKFVSMAEAQRSRDGWIRRLHCSRRPSAERAPFGPLQHFRGCTGHVEVMWRIHNGEPHSWPKGKYRDDALARMWRFFSINHD